jgi:two-component system, sensor histidine kinase
MNGTSKILIVDDHKENIVALTKLIESHEYEIHTATNAHEALSILTTEDFCLALLDVQMPEIDGFELARLIRGVKRHKHLPIIFVTAQSQDQLTLFEGYEAGAVDLLFKPLNPYIVRSKVSIFVDIDKQNRLLKEQVDELNKLRQQSESANIAKSQFLANMSHEIRTPLAAVMSFAEMIATNRYFDDEKEELITMIKKNGEHLLHLIDDILDISRIETSKVDLDNTAFSIISLLREVKSTLTLKADEKGIGLHFDIADICDTNYFSDPTRIKQILLNIIGNAIKFTTDGSVTVKISCVPDSDLHFDNYKILVQDAGIGISKEHQSKLFAAFSQGDASTRRQYGGSGLGLMISKNLANALGGDVKLVRSSASAGSLFEIELNLKKTEEMVKTPHKKGKREDSSATASKKVDFSNKKILVIDDYEENLIIIQMYLRSTNAELTLAQSGSEALQFFEDNGATKEPFDLILMDIQMPKMDGYATTKTLRSKGITTPIIAVTAHAIAKEQEKCIEAGCNEVLIKPLNRDKLVGNISKYLFES